MKLLVGRTPPANQPGNRGWSGNSLSLSLFLPSQFIKVLTGNSDVPASLRPPRFDDVKAQINFGVERT